MTVAPAVYIAPQACTGQLSEKWHFLLLFSSQHISASGKTINISIQSPFITYRELVSHNFL